MALRKGARSARRGDLRADRSDRGEAHALGRMASHHQQGRHRRRACGLRHRQLRPADRTPVRPQRALDSRRAPVHRLRRIARAQSLPPGRRPRARGAARVGPVLLPARRAHGLDLGSLRGGRAGALRRRRARLVRQESVRGRLGAAAAARRGRAAARALARELRHQGHRQRPHRLHAGRQPADRPRLGRAQSMAQRGPQLRHHRGGRLRLAVGRMDRRGRARHRHDGGRSAPLRSLHQQALRGAEERGDLSQRLRHPLSRTRSAPTRARRRPVRSTTSSSAWARCSASATAGSAPIGSRRRAFEPKDKWSFRRSNYFEHVGNEALRLRAARRRHRPDALHQARGHRARAPKPGSTAWWRTRCRPRSAAWRSATRSPAAAAFAPNSPSPRSPSSTSTW